MTFWANNSANWRQLNWMEYRQIPCPGWWRCHKQGRRLPTSWSDRRKNWTRSSVLRRTLPRLSVQWNRWTGTRVNRNRPATELSSPGWGWSAPESLAAKRTSGWSRSIRTDRRYAKWNRWNWKCRSGCWMNPGRCWNCFGWSCRGSSWKNWRNRRNPSSRFGDSWPRCRCHRLAANASCPGHCCG